MILHELRIMRGPNMWSDIQKLLVLKLDYSNISLKDIGVICEWQRLNIFISCDPKIYKQQPWHYVSLVIAELIKKLQPHSTDLFSGTKIFGNESHYVFVEYEDEKTGLEAAHSACEIIELVVSNHNNIPFEELQVKIEKIYNKQYPGPSTSTILKAAQAKGIPIRKSIGGYYVFGQGKYQKRIAASICENTSDISVEIAGDKEITKKILEEAFIPVPKGYVIQKEESIKELLPEINFPVVVKPLNANQGKGITANINSEKDLTVAFHLAKQFSNSVIIEKHISGNDYRFLVIGNKFVAAALRVTACVVGNGRSTISDLINQVNNDPLRGEGHRKVLTKITIDASTLTILRAKNLSLESVLENDVRLFLKDTANLSTGGTAIDVTDEVHPDNIILAERVAALIGLDICGIDIMATDVASPISENEGAVLEVNAAPGLRMHVSPSYGKSRNVGEPIIELMFPKGSNSRIPLVAVTGTNGKTTTTRLMAHVSSNQNYKVGYTTTDGIYVDKKIIYKGDCSGPKSARMILQEPYVDFAVLECARGGIIRSGLAFDQCDIGIVTNVAADHIGLKDINSIEDLAIVKAVVPRSVSKNGYAILNACDDLVFNMKNGLKCNVGLFSVKPKNQRITEHCSNGGYACILDENKDIIIIKGNERIFFDNAVNIPLTLNGKAEFMIDNVLPVVLASFILGFDLNVVKESLNNFNASVEQTPGRLNHFKINDVTLIVDYAHNPHGLRALAQYLNTITEHKVGIITGVGDRRDDDLIEMGKIAGEMYDEVIIRMDKDLRGRTVNEMSKLLIAGLIEIKPEIKYHVIPDSKEALQFAFDNGKPNSYVIISADDAIGTVALVQDLKENVIS